ncbi:hypothetical protein NDU88_002737 [Pleurodeles waltl]|uniref:Uncharacterized protein n=1 Tax=Pleurodeles waltl TaxID=8319 RepID=A0AAV7TP48_PLEWA|nr:hypothetical protein NDU88_002737 [Pleurodeles waltl]
MGCGVSCQTTHTRTEYNLGDKESQYAYYPGVEEEPPYGGRIFWLIATTTLAHPLSARGSHSPTAKAADAANAVRLQHGPLQTLYGSLAAPPRIVAARASTGGRRKKN